MSTVIQQITAFYFLILFSHFIADDENQHSFHLWKLLANGYTQTLKNTKNWKIPVNTLEPGKKKKNVYCHSTDYFLKQYLRVVFRLQTDL